MLQRMLCIYVLIPAPLNLLLHLTVYLLYISIYVIDSFCL